MLYVERDANGRITAIRHNPAANATEKKSLMDEEILEFLDRDAGSDSWVQMLSLSDISIIRILEDLIDLLIRKNIILFTDLPREAQQKIHERKQARRRVGEHNFMVDDIL